ncbi:helicase-exonuclease AddAB subunit AddA [Bacillus taeanensis]|uniref:ATP-dependent helicase/nuclease subunit A n=1 Tax=Bacillus taeanensis TaxID=273032 RepID=A0A366XUH4_9BACI|nr:helicase-exonuclease AddAB subunit AddA [Bacillus taeanensis]RBW69218.1 helicase-exonuclease AddAB subunit AddA [Bacillus taeanensis]
MMSEIIEKPANAVWTDDQWKAIAARGQNTLVAAAAGSGKTAVLVERIIERIKTKDDPVDVDRLLIVTFTNAAAAEMRQRIGEAIEAALEENPSSLHLRRQLSLLNKASISTLHSFCLEVLRQNYYKINLDPGFRIADQTEAELLRDEILEEMFEEHYSAENPEKFYEVVDRYSSDRSDQDLQILIEKIYDFSRSHPWPSHWLLEMVARYEITEGQKIDDIEWVKEIISDIFIQLNGIKEMLRKAAAIAESPEGPRPYLENLQREAHQVDSLLQGERTWEALYNGFQHLSFDRLKPCRGCDKVLQEEVKSLRASAKEAMESIQEDFFERHPNHYLDELRHTASVIRTLSALVNEFAKKYEEAKLEKGLVDFSDLEHYCLAILRDEASIPENVIPSETARSYQQQFAEVLVDEYQDTNQVQESIIQLVSKADEKNGNRFMVGDVKQSIYRFRLAEPALFLKKYKAYSKDGKGKGLRIDLSKNFRSRKEVLHATNFIFKQIMNEKVGELNYDDDAELRLGAEYPKSENVKAELLLINRSKDEKESNQGASVELDDSDFETVQLEARCIAEKIKELVGKENGTPAEVFDKKLQAMRPVQYRDIVILLRATSSWAPSLLEELKIQGIPAYAELSTGYFEATEVSIMMALLKVIDNPYQDIPLASVLRSPIIGCTEEEMAQIRLSDKQGYYFDAMKAYLNEENNTELNKKIVNFYDRLDSWRTKARQGALSDLIWHLYQETNYYDFVAGLPGGKQRQANLRALYDRARQYEETSFRGLFRFLRFIERMQDRGNDLGAARALTEQEDVVRVMTIHKSKGLEFPIVFTAGLSKQFNMQDLNRSYLLHKELGFGTKFIDPTNRLSYPTLLQLSIKQRMKLEMLAEEMRILYVALTRAKEKLYLVGTVKDLEKDVQKWGQHIHEKEWLLPDFERTKSRSYLDWIGPALIRHRDSQILRDYLSVSHLPAAEVYQDRSEWKISVIDAANFLTLSEHETDLMEETIEKIKNGKMVAVTSEEKETVYRSLQWKYEYEETSKIKSKQSVTEIKRQRESADEYSDTLLIRPFKKQISERPKFLQKERLTAAEKGSAMHMVMQHLSFDHAQSELEIKELLAKMVNKEILTSEQAETIEIKKIQAFFHSKLGKKMLNAEALHREIPFSLAVPANTITNNRSLKSNEKVLVQGVIDLIIEDHEGLTLIDYKTDTITGRVEGEIEEVKSILLNRYKIQLELYQNAVEQIWKKPLYNKYLYFFDGDIVVEV